MARARNAKQARRSPAKQGRSGPKRPGRRTSLLVASLAAGLAAGAAAGLIARRRRRKSQWQQFEPAVTPSTVDPGATAVVPAGEPSQPA